MNSETEDKNSSSMVLSLYNKRKQVFVQSLQSILMKISQDKIVFQMLQSRTSGQFITKRIEEIVAQVISDDREIFIDTLIQKLNSYEKLFNKDQAEMIRNLGTKILKISDSQNAGEVHYVRQIQSLTEQVQALQNEVVTLRTQKADQEVSISDLTKNLKVKTLDPDYDPSSPTFMHIFGMVDLTDFKVKLKLIRTDASTSRQLVVILINKMKKICTIMKNKAKESSRAYARRFAEVQAQQSKDNIKVSDIQRHYEDEVIPQLLIRHKDSMAKHKKIHQEMQEENDKLKAAISEYKNEIKTLKSNDRQHITEADILNKQIADRDAEIENLKMELQKSVLVIQAQKDSIQEKESKIMQLQDGTKEDKYSIDKLNDNLDSFRRKYEESQNKINSMEQELQESRLTKSRMEKMLNDANQELDSAKHENRKLIKSSTEKSNQITELRQKLNQIEPVFDTNKDELKELRVRFENLSNDHSDKKKILENLRRENESQKQTISKLEDLKADNAKQMEKQRSQIESQSTENNKLKDDMKTLSKKNSQLESDISKLKDDLEMAQAELEDCHRFKDQQNQQISAGREEKNEMKRKIREMTNELKEQESKYSDTIAELELHNKDIQKEKEEALSKVKDLENRLRSIQRAHQETDDQLKSHEKTIEQLEHDNSKLKKKIESLSNNHRQKEGIISKVENENKEFKEVFDEIQSIFPSIQSLSDLPEYIRELEKTHNLNNEICSLLGMNKPNELLPSLKNLKENSKILQRIARILGEKDLNNLVPTVQNLKEQYDNLAKEHQKIVDIIPGGDASEISAYISDIIRKQKDYEEQMQSAAEFLGKVLGTFSNSSQTSLSFPLSQKLKDDLLKLVKQIKARADSDRKQIDDILTMAKRYGYLGDDCQEAFKFLIDKRVEAESIKTMEEVEKKLDAVRVDSTKREDEFKARISKLEKKNKSLQALIAQLQSQRTDRDDEHTELTQSYEKKIQELEEELRNERRVREELCKIGDGMSADTKYLKTKLSAKELKFFTFIQKFMQSDKKGQEIQQKMQEERKNLLDPNLTSSKL